MVHKPIVFSSIIISCFLLAQACKSEKEFTLAPTNTKTDSVKIKYLALGDSYTKGESVDIKASFPYLLRDTIEKTPLFAVEKLQIIAQTGWTTTNLINAINSASITDTFDIVTLLIGVNNQYQKKPIDLYKTDFLQLVKQAIAFAGNNKDNVFVISIPDYGATSFGQSNSQQIGLEIDQYNVINKQISDSLSVSYINITPISRLAKNNPTLIAFDGLHPSGKMYNQWVELLYNEVKASIK